MLMTGLVRGLIPSLQSSLHKGSCGRIGVVGGCFEYTGAPYFAGIAALKTGVDLSHIFCEIGAAVPIKSYSPELIVHPYLQLQCDVEKEKKDAESHSTRVAAAVAQWLSKLHCLVIGPGLGRDPHILRTVEKIIERAISSDLPLVLDGDALFLVSNKPHLIMGYKNAVLTPNAVEYGRLVNAALSLKKNDASASSSSSYPALSSSSSSFPDKDIPVAALSKLFGHVTIVQKGAVDRISNGETTVTCEEAGSNRRCGGQGDLLAGSISAFIAWSNLRGQYSSNSVLAAYGGACLTRRCSRLAFEKKGRSVTTTDMIDEIHAAFEGLYGAEAKI